MNLGAALVLKTVTQIERGEITPIPQNNNQVLRAAPKLFKETCRIAWNIDTHDVHNFIRGLSPYPTAWTMLHTPEKEPITVKIYATTPHTEAHNHTPGVLITDGKNYLKVATADGYLDITELQLPGKKRMPIQDLLRGYKFENDSFFQ